MGCVLSHRLATSPRLYGSELRNAQACGVKAVASPMEDARAESAPQDGLVWQWSYRITGYGDRLWELWLHYVRPQATMPYAQFEALMPVYNPHYAVERVFDPAAVYNLPVGGPTIVGAEAR